MLRVLVVEDNPGFASFLQKGLSREGYAVTTAFDGQRGVQLALKDNFDLVILDIMLPGMDGQRVLEDLRKNKPALPVIMVTAKKDLESKIGSFDLGADDYLVKPFAFDELVARIRAHFRRRLEAASPTPVGDFVVDPHEHTVMYSGTLVPFTHKEFQLFVHLLNHAGETLNRPDIVRAVWKIDFDPTTNIVDVYIKHLRMKLAKAGCQDIIKTVRGAGYRLALVETAS